MDYTNAESESSKIVIFYRNRRGNESNPFVTKNDERALVS